jgi:predicted nucleotidyltransferase
MQIQEKYTEAVDEFVIRVLERYKDKIDRIILFGSVVRGDAREDSDIDILVIWKGDKVEGWDVLEDIANGYIIRIRATHLY